MKIHPLITTSDALADLCARLAKADFVTVDTEFMRENTYLARTVPDPDRRYRGSRGDRSAGAGAST